MHAHVTELPTRESDLVEAEWKPVRHHFGISAFGTNAYVAREAGQLLIEEHDETEHEELYVVLAGRVRFALASEELEVGPGTLVFARPGEERGAWALEAGAAVLAVGAAPGKRFEVSGWETGRLDR